MEAAPSKRKKVLGLFQLVMINVIAVDSIRTLPFSAAYGFSLVFFYLLAAICFFLPTALVSAELGTGWPNTGGIYVWVREAFGKKMSLVVLWLNWVYNLFWYPTIMALIAGTLTYLFNPSWAENKVYMSCSVIVIFWGTTLINCFGMRASSILSTIGALIGTIFPMLLITVLGAIWFFISNKVEIEFTSEAFFPDFSQKGNLAFLTNILFGLLGLELSATHAAEMRNPQKDYPRALMISSMIILGTIVFASLAIALVVPNRELSLVVGVMQAFKIFVDAYQLPWLLPMIAVFIVLGGLSGAGAWIIGPTKGLMVASQDGSLPKCLMKTTKNDVPINALLLQGFIVTILSLAFILLPTINQSFWILSAITAQLALIVYIALFASAIKLHYSQPDVKRSFRVPGNKIGMWTICLLGISSCAIVILLGFLPPEQIGVENIFSYEMTLIGGMVALCVLPLIYIFWKQKKLRA